MRTYLLFLLVLAPSVLLGQTVDERYKKFIKQHVKQDMNMNRCTKEMKNRKISKTIGNQCKEANTFIKAGTNEIKKVCNEAGKPNEKNPKFRESNQPFPVVTCKLRNNKRYPKCEYRGTSANVHIIIACVKGFPVHYEGDFPKPPANETDEHSVDLIDLTTVNDIKI